MKHIDKTLITAAAVLAAAVSLPATATAGDTTAAKARVVTDFRGAPPFKRRIVAAEDMAPKDTTREAKPASADANERVLVVERRGAPPYKRRFVEQDQVEVAEFARFEETADAKPTRRGPPGKLTSRR